jgi:hypothetical protein
MSANGNGEVGEKAEFDEKVGCHPFGHSHAMHIPEILQRSFQFL